MDEENFFDFIESVFEECNFAWRTVLVYVPEKAPVVSKWRRLWESNWAVTDPEQINWKPSPETAPECFQRWLQDMGMVNEDYLCIEERLLSGEIRFHVIVGDESIQDRSLIAWHEISGGWASKKAFNEKIKGLIANKVMREDCILTVSFRGYGIRYSKDNFRPWKTKD